MSKKETIALISFLVFYTSVLFGGFSWMLKSQIQPIKEILTNHITDTNKKIDDLKTETNKKLDHFREDMITLRQDMKDGFKEIKEIIMK